MPFKDKSIDFGYSSHVVEHLEKLEESLQEMQRVCKRGFITCPSAFREQIMALKIHIWFVENEDGCLVFTRKVKAYPEYIGDFFEKLMVSKKSYIFYDNLERNLKKIFFINYLWKNKINYEIRKRSNVNQWKVEGESEFQASKNITLFFREKILIYSSRIIRYFFSKRFSIEKILCCPFCKGGFVFDDKFVICKHCKTRFKHKDKRIFYFLDGESYD